MAADPFLVSVTQGEAFTITCLMVDNGVISAWTLAAYLRNSSGSTVLTITPVITDNGSTSTPGKFTVSLTATQTSALTANSVYQLSVWRTNSTSEAELVTGSLAVTGVGSSPMTALGSYATPSDLVKTHDRHDIGAYASDEGTELTLAQILAPDPVVVSALLRASGDVERACLAGGRYTTTDLAVLTGAAKATLVGLVCDLAYYRLAKRRLPDATKVAGYEEAQQMLKDLREGVAVFGISNVIEAGTVSSIDLMTDSKGREKRVTEMARRLFGQRMDNSRNQE